MNFEDNSVIAELARQQSIETKGKVYAVDEHGVDCVFIGGEMLRWVWFDDVEVTYRDDDPCFAEEVPGHRY